MRCVTGLRPRNRRSTAIRSRNTPMDSLLSVVALGHRVSTRNGAHLGGDDQRRSGATIVSRASAALGVPRSHHRSCRGAASFNLRSQTPPDPALPPDPASLSPERHIASPPSTGDEGPHHLDAAAPLPEA